MPVLSHSAGAPSRPGWLIALCLLVGGGFLSYLHAGPQGYASASQLIEQNIQKRKEQFLEAETLIAEGDVFVEQKEFGSAMANYRKAYQLLPDAPVTAELRDVARKKWAEAACIYAKEIGHGGRVEEAKQILDAVLAEDAYPGHAGAKRWRKRLDDPEWFNPVITPEHLENVSEAEKQLILARGFLQIADYDNAQKHYENVLRIDRTNTAAQRGIEEVEHQRMKYARTAYDRTRATMLGEVAKSWETEPPLDDEVFQRIFAGGGSVGGLASRGPLDELNTIIVPSVLFEEATLDEAVDYIFRKVRELRPGLAFNIIVDIPSEDNALKTLPINLQLKELPISVLLDFVTNATRTRWRTDDFSVIIEPRTSTLTQLVLRTYNVPPGFINSAPVDDGGGGGNPFEDEPDTGGGLQVRRLSAEEFLTKAGVSFPEGAFATINRGTSLLTIRNSSENLEVVESLIANARKGGAKNIVVEVKMIEVNHTKLKEVGFDWLLGQFNIPGNQRVFAGGGTQGNAAGNYSGENAPQDYTFFAPGSDRPIGNHPVTAGNRSGDFAIPENSIDAQILAANRQAPNRARTPGIFSVSGAFTDPEFQVVVRAINNNTGIDTVAAPTTITRPGQRSSIEVIREFIYPTEYDPPELPQSFGQFNLTGGGGIGAAPGLQQGGIPVTPAFPTAFEMRKVGTLLEVEASILPDGYTLEVNLTPQIVRFDGFVNYGTPITNGLTVLTSNEIFQPVFSLIRESVSVFVQDGSTIVIGGLMNEIATVVDDRTPFFGDIPGLGRLFQTKASQVEKKAIVFFVTARIIDPGGRPVNALSQ